MQLLQLPLLCRWLNHSVQELENGGFFLFYLADADKYVFIDAREMAPALSNEEMFDDANGDYSRVKALDSPLAAAIPGLPAALSHIAKRYGKLNLDTTMRDSIKIAKDGFRVSERYRRMASYRLECLKNNREASKIFLSKLEVTSSPFDKAT